MEGPFSTETKSTEAPQPSAGGLPGADSVFRLLGASHQGTVFHAENDYVTAAHVVSGQRQMFLEDRDGNLHRMGADVWIDQANDLAAMTPLTPGAMPPSQSLKLADSRTIKPGTKLEGYGFPMGQSATPAVLPGELIGTRKNSDVIRDQLLTAEGAVVGAKHLEELQQNKSAWVQESLNNDVVESRGALKHGFSGGPIVTEDGRVLSVASRIFGNETVSIPGQKVADLLEHKGKFMHVTGHYQTGLQSSWEDLNKHPLYGGTSAAFEAATMLGGANRVMGWTRTLAKTGTTLAAFALASDTYANATKLSYYAETRDKWRNGTALAGDVSMIAGLALSFAPAPLRFAARVLGATGLATRLAAELIPNEFYVDVKNFRVL